jgi:protein NrfD
MKEITITTNKMNPFVDPSLHIWSWDVAIYLFLGGLTAGILVIAALMILKNKGVKTDDSKAFSLSHSRLALLAPVLLSLGMFFLWIDLAKKVNVFKFYFTFNITSPMSWGAWVLLLVYPLSILMILSTFRTGYAKVYGWLEEKIKGNTFTSKHIAKFHWIFDFSEKHMQLIAKLTIPVATLLGIYTGILLSAFGARPFWNSAILGPLFLVSGVSTAAALVILLSREHKEQHFFTKIDLGLIFTEMTLLILFIIGMITSSLQHSNAIKIILGGPLTSFFWVLMVALGLLLPAFLKILELRGQKIPPALAASLVLIGGLILRVVMVKAGQLSSWMPL